jgi:hypothetical protein
LAASFRQGADLSPRRHCPQHIHSIRTEPILAMCERPHRLAAQPFTGTLKSCSQGSASCRRHVPCPIQPQKGVKCRKRVASRRTFKRWDEFRYNRGDPCQGDGYGHNPASPSKTLRAKMGFSFWPTGYGRLAEGCRSESRAGDADGPPRRAAKAKEKPAGVSQRVRCYRLSRLA